MKFCACFVIATNQAVTDWGLQIAFLSKGINQKDKASRWPAPRVKTDQQSEREREDDFGRAKKR